MFWRVRVSIYFGEFCRVLHPTFGLSTTILLRGREAGAREGRLLRVGGGDGDCLVVESGWKGDNGVGGGGGISALGWVEIAGAWGW